MSVFYTNQELVERGNISGKNGKQGLDPSTVKAIVGKNKKFELFSNQIVFWYTWMGDLDF